MTIPNAASIDMCEFGGLNEYVKLPVPFVAAVVPPDAEKAIDERPMPKVVTISEPDATLTPGLT